MPKIDANLFYHQRLIKAAEVYVSRKKRESHPDGEFDKVGRWYPSEEETCLYCGDIRRPSNTYKYSLMIHCRTCDHIANLYGVSSLDIKRCVNKGTLPFIEEGEYYKEVAVVDGRYYSIFDGATEYQIGVRLTQSAMPNHKGGFYVYKTVEEAGDVSVPRGSKLKDAPRAMLKLYCSGNYCKYNNGKISFSEVTPTEVIVR